MNDACDRIEKLPSVVEQATQIKCAKIQTLLPLMLSRLRKQSVEMLACGGSIASKSCNHSGVVIIPMASQLD